VDSCYLIGIIGSTRSNICHVFSLWLDMPDSYSPFFVVSRLNPEADLICAFVRQGKIEASRLCTSVTVTDG